MPELPAPEAPEAAMTTDKGSRALAEPQTNAGRLLLMAGLTFHSGRRLADTPELVADIEVEARATDAAELDRLRAALREVLTALEDEDQLAHGEAVKEGNGGYIGLGVCAYCDGEWPCRTERHSEPVRAAIHAALAPEGSAGTLPLGPAASVQPWQDPDHGRGTE